MHGRPVLLFILLLRIVYYILKRELRLDLLILCILKLNGNYMYQAL
jgi:hypothetical protein